MNYMLKHLNCDVLSKLREVVDTNTKSYREDLIHDELGFRKAAVEQNPDMSRFLWLSRKNGTVCVNERNAYITGTDANTIWRYYAEQKSPDDRYVAYAVEITGISDGRIIGNLHTLDYENHIKSLVKNEVPLASVDVLFSNGTTINMQTLELDTYRQSYTLVHGDIVSKKPMPEDEPVLQAILKDERKQCDRQCRNADIKPKNRSIKSQLEEYKWQVDMKTGEMSYTSKQNTNQRTQEVL